MDLIFSDNVPGSVLSSWTVRNRATRYPIQHYRTRGENAAATITTAATLYAALLPQHLLKVDVQAGWAQGATEAPVMCSAVREVINTAAQNTTLLCVRTYQHHIPHHFELDVETAGNVHDITTEIPITLQPINGEIAVFKVDAQGKEIYKVFVKGWNCALAAMLMGYIICKSVAKEIAPAEVPNELTMNVMRRMPYLLMSEMTRMFEQLNTLLNANAELVAERRAAEESAQSAARMNVETAHMLEHINQLFLHTNEEQLARKIAEENSRVADLQTRLERQIVELQRAQHEYYTAVVLGQANTEMANALKAFLTNPRVTTWCRTVNWSDTHWHFAISTDIHPSDMETARRVIDRAISRAERYEHQSPEYLWKKVVRHCMCGTWTWHGTDIISMDLSTGNIREVSALTRDEDHGLDVILPGLPNPHHRFYNCWGENARHIASATREKDFANMLVQIKSAVSYINFEDSAVTDKLFDHRNWVDCKQKAIEVPGLNARLSPRQAIAYLREHPELVLA